MNKEVFTLESYWVGIISDILKIGRDKKTLTPSFLNMSNSVP